MRKYILHGLADHSATRKVGTEHRLQLDCGPERPSSARRHPRRCRAVCGAGQRPVFASGAKILIRHAPLVQCKQMPFEDLVCLTRLPVLTLKFLDAIPLYRGYVVALACIRLILLYPDAQAVSTARNLLRDRQYSRRSARVFSFVIQHHPNRSRAQFVWIACSVLGLSQGPVSLLLGHRQAMGDSTYVKAEEPTEPMPYCSLHDV